MRHPFANTSLPQSDIMFCSLITDAPWIYFRFYADQYNDIWTKWIIMSFIPWKSNPPCIKQYIINTFVKNILCIYLQYIQVKSNMVSMYSVPLKNNNITFKLIKINGFRKHSFVCLSVLHSSLLYMSTSKIINSATN